MYLRKVKRKCNVRGCKNTDCFSLSRTREVGNSVIICKSCLGAALNAADEINAKTGDNIERAAGIPPLFFNHAALLSEESQEEAAEDEALFVCEKCQKSFTTERGLRSHMKSCNAEVAGTGDK